MDMKCSVNVSVLSLKKLGKFPKRGIISPSQSKLIIDWQNQVTEDLGNNKGVVLQLSVFKLTLETYGQVHFMYI